MLATNLSGAQGLSYTRLTCSAARENTKGPVIYCKIDTVDDSMHGP